MSLKTLQDVIYLTEVECVHGSFLTLRTLRETTSPTSLSFQGGGAHGREAFSEKAPQDSRQLSAILQTHR